MELGGDGVPLHREFSVPGDVILPGDGGHALEQGLEVRRRKAGQLQQHPGAAAQVDVQPGNVRRCAVAVDPAVFGPDVLQVQPSQFVSHQALQPEEAGNGQCHKRDSFQTVVFQDQYSRKSAGAQRVAFERPCGMTDPEGKDSWDCYQNEMVFSAAV